MLKRVIFIALTVGIFVSCHNTLDILAPYKESVCVYGLLDQDASTQYVRVQRVFLGEGDAFTMAQNPDSSWYKPGELKVSLQRIKNGIPVSVDAPATSNMEIVLTETFVTTDAGVFDSNQLLYMTTHAIYDDGSQYKLLIHNNRTGADFSSSAVSLVRDFSTKLIYGQQGSQMTSAYSPVNFVTHGSVKCKYASPANAGVCGLKMRFFYTEYLTSNPNPVPKSADFDLGIQYTNTQSGNEEIDLSFSGDVMLFNISERLGINSDITHRTADSIHFLLNGAGFDLALYNQVTTTTTMSQEKPSYTNINGGVGVFSSRREYKLRKRNHNDAVDRLASDQLSCPLRFYGAGGGFLPCQ